MTAYNEDLQGIVLSWMISDPRNREFFIRELSEIVARCDDEGDVSTELADIVNDAINEDLDDVVTTSDLVRRILEYANDAVDPYQPAYDFYLEAVTNGWVDPVGSDSYSRRSTKSTAGKAASKSCASKSKIKSKPKAPVKSASSKGRAPAKKPTSKTKGRR